MHQGLVGVYHLLQVDGLIAVVSESGIMIELFVGFDNVGLRSLGADNGSTEDATGKIATIRDEVDVGIEVALHLFDALFDFCQMLVSESLGTENTAIRPNNLENNAIVDKLLTK